MRVAVVPAKHGLLVLEPGEDDLLAARRPRRLDAKTSRSGLERTDEIGCSCGAARRRLPRDECRCEDDRRQCEDAANCAYLFHNSSASTIPRESDAFAGSRRKAVRRG